MDKLIIGGMALAVALLWVLGNASWGLLLVNLLWLFFKGATLFSWWIPFTCIGAFVVLLIAVFSTILWSRT